MSAGISSAAFGAALVRKRANKYGAVRTTVDGVTFHGKGEAKRYHELRLLERAGEISALNRQVTFPLTVNGVRICDYVADFSYVRQGVLFVEDFKGVRTAEYRLKKKLMRAVHGVEIHETGTQRRTRRRKP